MASTWCNLQVSQAVVTFNHGENCGMGIKRSVFYKTAVRTSQNDDASLSLISAKNSSVVSTLWSLFVLVLMFALATSSTVAHAQATQSLEIGSGTVGRGVNNLPQQQRIRFNPLATGEHTLRVVWQGNANIRFAVFLDDGARIATAPVSGSPAQWTGMLDITEEYFINCLLYTSPSPRDRG